MLDIKSVEWKNFMSYGDYITTLDLENLGPCLIRGEIRDEDSRETYDDSDNSDKLKSNGAGKSALVNIMQWVIFGRTMHSSNPGDAIMNYFTGEDCYGKVTFKNGDFILRTRTKSGSNELIYCKEGDETKLTADTLSTTKNMQTKLNKVFRLDWDLFSNNVFFNQYSKPWLEMAEAPRKKALERMLRIDRFAYYAKVAKAKIDGVIRNNEEHQKRFKFVSDQVAMFKKNRETSQKMSNEYEENKYVRISDIVAQIDNIRADIDSTEVPDIERLTKKWDIVKEINTKIRELEQGLNKLNNKISDIEFKLSNTQSLINKWKEKSGKMCLSCNQDIAESHVTSIIEPHIAESGKLEAKLKENKDLKSKTESKIKAIKQALLDKTPAVTLDSAKETLSWIKRKSNEISQLELNIQKIKDETNPYINAVEEYDIKIRELDEELKTFESRSQKNDYVEKHLNYIYKAYNDRNKIKSMVIQEHIPFINGRLKHYLEIFGLDVQIELTDNLSIKSNKWGYDFESGGERKRTDVAFMLATFDFHEYMYGRQCNILILDEVDGRLDGDGVNSLVSIINNDIATKVETVLIISHKSDMHDVFNSQINIIRENRFSRIDSVVR